MPDNLTFSQLIQRQGLRKAASSGVKERNAGEAQLSTLAIDKLNPMATDANDSAENGFCRPHTSSKAWQRLRRGKLVPEQTLDLHGSRLASAQQEIETFLVEACAHKVSCVRIIHGKGLHSPPGQATLKDLTKTWLKQYNSVLAYYPRKDASGGFGATDVLLKIIP